MIIRHGIWWDRFWGMIPKVLPTVYDDSLSYYEVLNKLIKATGELAGAIDGIDPAEVRENATAAAESAESASESAQSAQAYAESAEQSAEQFVPVQVGINTISVNPAILEFVSANTKIYTIGKLCVGTIGLKFKWEFEAGDDLVWNLPKPKNVASEGCKILGVQVNDTAGAVGQTIFASIVNAPSEPRGAKLAFNASEGYIGDGAQVLFTLCYVTE